MYHETGNCVEGSYSPLTPSAHCSIHNLSQAYPGSKTRWTERKRNKSQNSLKELFEWLVSTFFFFQEPSMIHVLFYRLPFCLEYPLSSFSSNFCRLESVLMLSRDL